MNKGTSTIVGDAGKAISCDGPQPSSSVSLAAHDAPIAQVDSPLQESSELDEGVKEPMQVDKDNLREGDPVASATIIDEGKTIVINDSKSDNDGQVVLMDTLAEQEDPPALGPTNIYIATKASGINSS